MRGDVIWDCLAWAVTPVHIGGGEEWTKQDYVIRDGHLCRIDPARLMARMEGRARKEVEHAIDRGDLQAAARLLGDAVDDADVLERIPLGPRSRQDLEQAQQDSKRWGEVTSFIRTGGRPFVPGSSVKGAIRTALLNAVVQERGVREAPSRTDQLQQWAFQYDRRHTEQDPFRFLEVSDAVLPEGATRIDRVVNWRPDGKDTARKIQIHVERLLGCADGPARRFELSIRIDTGRLAEASKRDPRKAPRFAGLGPQKLIAAVNRFYWRRWRWELGKFFPECQKDLARLPSIKSGDKILGPDQLADHPRIMLLRVGRFTQFESKSVDGIRRGVIRLPKGGMKRAAEGSTRNIIELPPRGRPGRVTIPVPMGWLLVFIREMRNG